MGAMENFQARRDELLLENPNDQVWHIPRLISASIVADESRKQNAVDLTLDADTAALLQKQTTKPT